MDEHPNIALLRGGYAAFNSGDMETLDGLFADDIAWHTAGRSPLSGDKAGKEEVFAFFGNLMELSSGTFRVEVHDILANDEHCVVLTHETASRDGRMLDAHDVHTFHMSEGKVTEFWDSPVDQYAFDEFWS